MFNNYMLNLCFCCVYLWFLRVLFIPVLLIFSVFFVFSLFLVPPCVFCYSHCFSTVNLCSSTSHLFPVVILPRSPSVLSAFIHLQSAIVCSWSLVMFCMFVFYFIFLSDSFLLSFFLIQIKGFFLFF